MAAPIGPAIAIPMPAPISEPVLLLAKLEMPVSIELAVPKSPVSLVPVWMPAAEPSMPLVRMMRLVSPPMLASMLFSEVSIAAE